MSMKFERDERKFDFHDIGCEIKRKRETSGMTQDQLAFIIDRDPRTIIYNENDGQIVLEEYIEGLTVAQIMETDKYRSAGARKVLLGLCDALTVLHDRDIIHRDVKPENVIVESSGRVVLIDFNASRIESDASKDTVIMGTVGYASPEQLGLAQTDARTDIYAVGVLYNVMLTGQHPSVTIALGKVGRIVRKCTAVNPNERYQTAIELWEAL